MYDAEYQKEYRKNNKEKAKEYNKQYYKEYREEIKDKSNKYYQEHTEEILIKNVVWRENNKEKIRERNRMWKRKMYRNADDELRLKLSCRCKLNYAINCKKIIRQPCKICEELKVEAHHEDYNKPYEVEWLCIKHHRKLHSN